MKHSLLLWLIWVCLIQKLISVSTLLGSNICLDDQKSLLLQLKGNLSYSYNRNTSSVSKLASWNQTLDCCQWGGVQCDNNTGYVTGLDLAGESITNSSDNLRSLFGLQFLQKLNLANNSFNNTVIPSGIRKLAALTHLNLSNAGFGGRVPLEISRLVNLIMLDLSSLSSYLGFPPLRLENPSLAMLIGGLKNLEGLYLNGVLISANGSDWGKALSTSVPNLKFLSLSNCDLSGKIDPSLMKLRSLSEIHLDQNNLDGPVPDFIANFQSLTTLTLSNCKLAETFPERILRLPTLKSLDLSYNGLLKGSLPEFPINNSLQTLVVSYSRFSGQLPNSVGRLVHLQRIELQNCSFVGSIPSSIKQLRQLQCVDLSNNQFSGLMPSFSSAKNLRNLFLNSNELTGTLSSTKWASLSNLSNLDLSSNSLNGNIPASLFGLPSLQSVQLYQNEFTGELAEFAIFSPMQILDLSINRLEGSIPKSMFKLQGLKVLKLSYNKFNGSVDLNVIRYLKNLTVLELSFNSLQVITSTGADIPQLRSLRLASCKLRAIPTFLKRQFIMQYLDLSDNQIKGRIPRWIWTIGNSSLSQLNLSCNSFIEWELDFSEIRSLMVLDLHSNKLQGVVPYPPSGIMYLDYSDNNFTSSIPPKIGDFLSYSILFSLSNNNLSGSIPMSLCNLIHLQGLDLSNNQLDGAIPRCLIEMTSTLGVLNLSKNKLRGLTTDTFPENCSLRTLDLNANYLQGSVPISLAYCKQLRGVKPWKQSIQ